jgi:hypothetical protein
MRLRYTKGASTLARPPFSAAYTPHAALQNVGLRQTLDLIGQQCELAERALDSLPQSEARSALLDLTASLRGRAEQMINDK